MFQDITLAFAQVAKERGAAVALQYGGIQISYGDLDRISTVLADRMIKAGVTSGELVGVSATQDPGTIIGLLAILKAGAGYVPLPDYYPAARLRLMAEDADVSLILGSVPALAGMAIPQIAFDWQTCPDTATPALPSH